MEGQRGLGRRWVLLGVLAVLLSALFIATLDAAPSEQAPTGNGEGTASPEQSRSAEDTDELGLLPNLQIMPATSVQLDTSGPARLLRFDSRLVNAGEGPLEVEPMLLPRCPRGQRHVAQIIYVDANGSGAYERDADRERNAAAAGCMLFHRGHDHWHIDATAQYALTRLDSLTALVSREKVSFCLRDSDRLRPGEGAPKTYGECSRDKRQGISTGWTDLYDYQLDGQTLRLRNSLPDGDYCLRLRTDPFDLFRETDESDNHSAVRVRLSRDQVTVPQAGCPT